jgi:hypothetical protein
MCFSTRAARVIDSFGCEKMEDVRSLPTRRHRGEGRLQLGIRGELGLELLGQLEVLGFCTFSPARSISIASRT